MDGGTTAAPTSPPLRDAFGRIHRSLRVSVTDRCNLRCRYCMPVHGMEWLPGGSLMSDDEAVALTRLLARLGIRHVRVTGGEPLVRPGLPGIVRGIVAAPGVRDVSLTTNGVLLARRLPDLAAAGLRRVNVSLDSPDPERFAAITRRRDLHRVLEGIAAACADPRVGPVKVNAVVMRGVNEDDVLPLAQMARDLPVVVRFVEVMPLDAQRAWEPRDVVTGAEVRAIIAARWPIVPLGRGRASDTGTRFAFADRPGAAIETVSPVSESFCASCDRLRLTADGRLRTCLYEEEETDLLGPLRAGVGPAEMEGIVRRAVAAKGPGHGIGDPRWRYHGRSMSRIGG